MGQNSLYKVLKGQSIAADEGNSISAALVGDFVPRDPGTFEAADIGGNLGSTSDRWEDLYVKKIFIGESANKLSIEEDVAGASHDFLFKFFGNTLGRITEGGIIGRSLISFSDNVKLGNLNASFSGSGTSPTVYSTVTLTTVGRPVLVGLNPNASNSWLQVFQAVNAAGAPNSKYKILRDGSTIYSSIHQQHGNALSHPAKTYQLSSSMIWFIDVFAPAGSHTYDFTVNLISGNGGTSYAGNNIQIFAYELA